jgi:Ser/Thr protein kinase RdoA (MazF antagonist)
VNVPPEVLAAWGWQDAELAAIPGGLINSTFAVRIAGIPVAVIQRLHPIFGAAVNLDIDAVTTHLASRGVETPRLMFTRAREPSFVHDGRIWRALTWVAGSTVHRVPDPSWAEAGGLLVGTFHRAVADLHYEYAFARAGVHDTAAHLERLRNHVDQGGAIPGQGEPIELGRQILEAAKALPPLPATPLRHCHGDLKISNLMFDVGPPVRATSLVDLDTLGHGTIAFELGDALRSWCNPRGEDAAGIGFDLSIFAAAIRGFRAIAGPLISHDERASIVLGTETVCIELAARFAVDVFRDEYFGWDSSRFSSRCEHNMVRARGQLALGRAVRAVRQDALDLVLMGT